MLWAIGWWAWYRRPDVKAGVNDAELAIIHESHREEAATNLHPEVEPMRIIDLFKQRTVWGMMLGFFCLNFMITFFLTWFPSYLVNERGFNLLKLGIFGSIPPIAAILGSWAGGLVRRLPAQAGLVAEQGPQDLPRRRHAGLLGDRPGRHRPAGLAGPRADVHLLRRLGLHHRHHLVPARRRRRLQHRRHLGGTQNFFSNIGSALSPIIIGALYGATGSFEVPLLLTGVVVVAGALCFGFLIKKVEPIPRRDIQLATT